MESDWRGRANLNVGQEAIFFLERNPANDFYSQIEYSRPLAKSDLNYESERKAVIRLLNVYADPHQALLADKAADRQFAAIALVARYRAPRHYQNTNEFAGEPIPADESRLILETLAEMKWGDVPFDARGVFSLQNAFWQLQLTEKDGWKPPQPKANEDANEVMGKAAVKWIKENGGKYRMLRLVEKPQTAQ